jgi:hypothetical protein
MKIVTQLRAVGETNPSEELARISSLMHQYVIPNGTFTSPILTPEIDTG